MSSSFLGGVPISVLLKSHFAIQLMRTCGHYDDVTPFVRPPLNQQDLYKVESAELLWDQLLVQMPPPGNNMVGTASSGVAASRHTGTGAGAAGRGASGDGDGSSGRSAPGGSSSSSGGGAEQDLDIDLDVFKSSGGGGGSGGGITANTIVDSLVMGVC